MGDLSSTLYTDILLITLIVILSGFDKPHLTEAPQRVHRITEGRV